MTDLLSQLERATEGSRELDWWIAYAIEHPAMEGARDVGEGTIGFLPFVPGSEADKSIPHYTTNLQDAVSLAESRGMAWRIDSEGEAWVWLPDTAWAIEAAIGHDPVFNGNVPISPPLSLCIAIIKALESKAEHLTAPQKLAEELRKW